MYSLHVWTVLGCVLWTALALPSVGPAHYQISGTDAYSCLNEANPQVVCMRTFDRHYDHYLATVCLPSDPAVSQQPPPAGLYHLEVALEIDTVEGFFGGGVLQVAVPPLDTTLNPAPHHYTRAYIRPVLFNETLNASYDASDSYRATIASPAHYGPRVLPPAFSFQSNPLMAFHTKGEVLIGTFQSFDYHGCFSIELLLDWLASVGLPPPDSAYRIFHFVATYMGSVLPQ